MDFSFIANTNLVGQGFYNPEEYNEQGIVYTIIDMTDFSIDIEWVDPDDGQKDYSSITLPDFIKDLNRGFYVLMSEDRNMSFLDQIW